MWLLTKLDGKYMWKWYNYGNEIEINFEIDIEIDIKIENKIQVTCILMSFLQSKSHIRIY